MRSLLHPRFSQPIGRLLHHSWKDIDFKYEGLTDEEKELISEEDFVALLPWVLQQGKTKAEAEYG